MSGEVTAVWEWNCLGMILPAILPFWLDYLHNHTEILFFLSHNALCKKIPYLLVGVYVPFLFEYLYKHSIITNFNHTWPIATKTGINKTIYCALITHSIWCIHTYIPCIHAGPMECCYGRLWRMDRCHWKIWMSKTLSTELRMYLCSTRGNMVAKIGDLPDCACCQFLMHTATAGSCTHSPEMRPSKCHARFRVSTSYSLVCTYSSIPCTIKFIGMILQKPDFILTCPTLIACSCFLTTPSIFCCWLYIFKVALCISFSLAGPKTVLMRFFL